MPNVLRRFAGSLQLLFVVVVVGGAILLSVALKPDSYSRPSAQGSEAPLVSVAVPETSDYQPSINLNGVVTARTTTDVIPQVSGRVIGVSPDFRPGGAFARGDVLFRVDPSDYELAVERTLAEIEAARSELALLEAQAAAERKIWNQQFSDRKIPDLIARVPQIAAAKARIHSGEAARAAAELSLDRTVVRAPFDGRVLDTRLDVGQVVTSNVAVGAIFSADGLEVSVPVSRENLAMLGDAVGSNAVITRPGSPGTTLNARVVRRAASVDDRTRLGTLFLAADDNEELLLGEFVDVDIRGDAAISTLRIPVAALTSRDQVWVVEDGILREREVNVLGNEGDVAVVRDFDYAGGVVTIPPANGRSGLPVMAHTESSLAPGGGVSADAD